jgi:hypothetical protein
MRTFKALLLLLALPAAAQEITFNATVDRNSVATGDPIKLTLQLNNAPPGSGISPPELGGLVVVQGPFDQNSFSNINGRLSSSVARTYILQATQPGDYTIGPATARVGGGGIQTQPIRIHVVKGESTGPASATLNEAQKRDPNLFCTISLSKSKAYVGEQVVATYTLYSRYNALQPGDYDLPKLDGFWAEEIDLGETSWDKKPTVVNGLPYNTATLKKQVLFPQRSGKLRIAPMTLNYRVNPGFFSAGTPVTITSNSAELTALDLPTPKPADHIGAVGELKMDVEVGSTAVKANEAIDLMVRFSGRANLKLIDAPKLAFPTDFETYDPKVSDRITVNSGGMNGSRAFQYLVIPRHEGEYTVGPITFSYFDPGSGTYRQLTSPAVTFTIAKGEGAAAVPTGPGRTEVKQLDRDIRYIRSGDLELEALDSHLYGSWSYAVGMVLPPFAFVGFAAWQRRRARLSADTTGMRRRKADRVARTRLKSAEEALKRGDREAFYTALGKALEGYAADKFDLGVAQVNQATLDERIGHIDGGEVARAYGTLLADLEMARFAPLEGRGREQLYEQAAMLIGRIEDHA